MDSKFSYQRHVLRDVIRVTHIVNVSYYKFPKNFRFGGESHDFWEFIYLDKGEAIVTAGVRDYVIRAGELVFHKPNEFHDVQATGTSAPNATVVSFCCKSRAMRYFQDKILFLSDREKTLLSRIVQEAAQGYVPLEDAPPVTSMRRASNPPFGADQLIANSIEELLISIRRRGDGISTSTRRLPPKHRENYKKLTRQVLQLLEESVSERVTLSELSRKLHVSVSQIKQVFREETGKSVIDYAIAMKIDEAKRLIQEGTLNFTQIADRLGYENIYYFSRAFKAKVGMTPTEYALSVQSGHSSG